MRVYRWICAGYVYMYFYDSLIFYLTMHSSHFVLTVISVSDMAERNKPYANKSNTTTGLQIWAQISEAILAL